MRDLCVAVGLALALGAAASVRAQPHPAAEQAGGILLASGNATPVEQAWRAPASGIIQRVERTRAAALALGIRGVETAAHAVLAGSPEPGLDAAEAAVRLAPDLPAAQWALARARLHAGRPLDAVRAAHASLRALERHLEASIWLRGALLGLVATALALGGLLFIVLAGAVALPHAAHDLGDLISRALPLHARTSLLGLLLLTPAFLGAGLLGVVLAAFAIALVFADPGRRLALCVAGAALWAGAFPLSHRAGDLLASLAAEPVTRAAAAVERGSASPLSLTRLERAAASDPVAAFALALRARREGDPAGADARYAELRKSRPTDPVLANNAANARMALGDTAGAIALYRAAAQRLDSAVILYNLSQAYGQAIQPLEQDRALARAQKLDLEVVDELSELTAPFGTAFVADLTTPVSELRARLLAASPGGDLVGTLAAGVSPAPMLRDARVCGLLLGVLALLCPALATRFRASRVCARCGRRVCPRCHGEASSGMCAGCARLFKQPEGTDPALRTARLAELRRRQILRDRAAVAAAFVLPGAAGLLAERPLLSLLAAILCSGAAAAAALAASGIPEPAAAGGAAGLALALAGATAGVLYAVLTAFGVMLRRDR